MGEQIDQERAACLVAAHFEATVGMPPIVQAAAAVPEGWLVTLAVEARRERFALLVGDDGRGARFAPEQFAA